VGDDVSVDNEILLLTDFMNFKIKSAQSFEDAHRGRVCVHVFVRMNDHIYIYMCVFVLYFKKTKNSPAERLS
jgi:hypothetical protein